MSQTSETEEDFNWKFFSIYDDLGPLERKIFRSIQARVKMHISAHPRQQTIADAVGCSRKHVNRTIGKFKKLGWVMLVCRSPRSPKRILMAPEVRDIDVVNRQCVRRIKVTTIVPKNDAQNSLNNKYKKYTCLQNECRSKDLSKIELIPPDQTETITTITEYRYSPKLKVTKSVFKSTNGDPIEPKPSPTTTKPKKTQPSSNKGHSQGSLHKKCETKHSTSSQAEGSPPNKRGPGRPSFMKKPFTILQKSPNLTKFFSEKPDLHLMCSLFPEAIQIRAIALTGKVVRESSLAQKEGRQPKVNIRDPLTYCTGIMKKLAKDQGIKIDWYSYYKTKEHLDDISKNRELSQDIEELTLGLRDSMEYKDKGMLPGVRFKELEESMGDSMPERDPSGVFSYA